MKTILTFALTVAALGAPAPGQDHTIREALHALDTGGAPPPESMPAGDTIGSLPVSIQTRDGLARAVPGWAGPAPFEIQGVPYMTASDFALYARSGWLGLGAEAESYQDLEAKWTSGGVEHKVVTKAKPGESQEKQSERHEAMVSIEKLKYPPDRSSVMLLDVGCGCDSGAWAETCWRMAA